MNRTLRKRPLKKRGKVHPLFCKDYNQKDIDMISRILGKTNGALMELKVEERFPHALKNLKFGMIGNSI